METRPTVSVIGSDVEVHCALALELHRPHFDTRCFSSISEFSEAVPLVTTGCVIMLPELTSSEGLEFLRQLEQAQSPLSVICLGSDVEAATAISLMEHGATVLIDTPIIDAGISNEIERALEISNTRYRARQHDDSIRQRFATLSDDEREVLCLLLKGVPNKGIAHALNLGARTIDRRRHDILEKMQVDSIVEVAMLLAELEPPMQL